MNTKSQAKSREIVALQWLVTPLNEELDKLDSSWASCVEARRFSPAIDTLHAIGNIFALANLPMFSKLAKLLQHACEQMDAGALPLSFAPNVYYTNKLLRYELSRFVLTAEPSTMLPLRLAYLSQLLREAGIDAPADSETALDDKALFSQQLIIPDLQTGALSAVDYDKLLVAWRYISQQLLQANDNDGERLQILSKIADSYAKEAKQVTSERLWYVAKMWLDSLVLNELPKPHSYSHLLAQLEQAMTASDKDSEALLRLENLLMDIFVALAALAQMSDDAKELTAQLQHDLSLIHI